ncbi:MAG: ABC transporter permease [Betaproteobacteria bacterium]|jgi:lipopolysaccharide transport system permease protein
MTSVGLLTSLWNNRGIARQFAWRDILGRYRGSYLGLLWAFVVPLATVAVFSFVFGTIFGARWTAIGLEGDRSAFALPMFAGLLVHMFVAECATRAPGLIVGNANFVKRVVFPLEALCSASVLAALFHVAVGFVVLFLWGLFTGVRPTMHLLWVPLIWMPLVSFALGLSLLLAALGVFLRDIAQFMGLAMTGLMFLAPIMYPLEAIPKNYVWLVYLNPLTPFIEMTRDAAILGRAPMVGEFLIAVAIGFVAIASGSWFFARARRAFADVI